MPATDYQGSSVPFDSIGRFILNIRCDQFHPSDLDDGSGVEVELESFQKLVADLFLDLGSGGADLLSLVWVQKLLDTFLIFQEEFRVILFNDMSLLSRPTLDRLISEFFERSILAVDVCNTIHDGIALVREGQRHLEIVPAALEPRQHSFGADQLRRARAALTDLTFLMLDEKEAGSTIAHRNRSFGRNSHGTDHPFRPVIPFRSLSWSVTRSWSANRQLQAIGNNLAALKGNEISTTSGLAVPVFTTNSVLLFVMWALVAAILCQDRGPLPHFSIPRNFLWAAPVMSLHDQILEESSTRDRKNSCGLLWEIHQLEECCHHLMVLIDTIQLLGLRVWRRNHTTHSSIGMPAFF